MILASIFAAALALGGIILFLRDGPLRLAGIILLVSAALVLAVELAMFLYIRSMPMP